MTVVPIAIITRIVKSVGVISPRWSPMFRRMSSIIPLAFISMATPSASRLLAPVSLAASQQASPFPAQADEEHQQRDRPEPG